MFTGISISKVIWTYLVTTNNCDKLKCYTCDFKVTHNHLSWLRMRTFKKYIKSTKHVNDALTCTAIRKVIATNNCSNYYLSSTGWMVSKVYHDTSSVFLLFTINTVCINGGITQTFVA